MDKLAKCPFCGGEALLFRGIGCMLVKCANAGCPLHDVDMGVASWDRRPLEEELEQDKAELVEACKDVILSAEYSDKVADFVSSCELGEAINRMRAALRKAEGKE